MVVTPRAGSVMVIEGPLTAMTGACAEAVQKGRIRPKEPALGLLAVS
jgi:hypothetical protein